ncbi:Protein kinase-like protein [Gracilaria domingensis]|nr:Protein kinase-like protein [Gracilaria domingensis]
MADFANVDPTQLKRGEWSWDTCIANDFQELQALVVSLKYKKVLVKQEEGRHVLPGCLYSRVDFPSAFQPVHIIPDVQDMIDSDSPLVFLRQLWRRLKPVVVDLYHREYEKVVVLLEFTDQVPVDCDGFLYPQDEQVLRWIPVEEANVFHMIDEAQTSIGNEMKRIAAGIEPENRLSWQRQGWFHMATSWMKHQLSTVCEASITGDIIQLRSSHLGAILAAETTRGRFFLKCTSVVSNDASFTRMLASLSPSHVKSPVAVDAKRQLLLTADYGDIIDPGDLCEKERLRFTSNYAHLQMDTMNRIEELIAAGFPDMRYSKLLEHLERLNSCSFFGALGNFDERVRMEVQFFRNSREQIETELAKLETVPQLAATVTHNDLFRSNIYWNGDAGKYMFFDFVESYISHPFACEMANIDEKQYLREWSANTGATTRELEKLWSPSYMSHLFAVLVLRLEEAQNADFQNRNKALRKHASLCACSTEGCVGV